MKTQKPKKRSDNTEPADKLNIYGMTREEVLEEANNFYQVSKEEILIGARIALAIENGALMFFNRKDEVLFIDFDDYENSLTDPKNRVYVHANSEDYIVAERHFPNCSPEAGWLLARGARLIDESRYSDEEVFAGTTHKPPHP